MLRRSGRYDNDGTEVHLDSWRPSMYRLICIYSVRYLSRLYLVFVVKKIVRQSGPDI